MHKYYVHTNVHAQVQLCQTGSRMAACCFPGHLTLLVVKTNVHHEQDSYSVHILQHQNEHIILMTVNASNYEVSYLGKVQICLCAAILSLPIWSIGLV